MQCTLTWKLKRNLREWCVGVFMPSMLFAKEIVFFLSKSSCPEIGSQGQQLRDNNFRYSSQSVWKKFPFTVSVLSPQLQDRFHATEYAGEYTTRVGSEGKSEGESIELRETTTTRSYRTTQLRAQLQWDWLGKAGNDLDPWVQRLLKEQRTSSLPRVVNSTFSLSLSLLQSPPQYSLPFSSLIIHVLTFWVTHNEPFPA